MNPQTRWGLWNWVNVVFVFAFMLAAMALLYHACDLHGWQFWQ